MSTIIDSTRVATEDELKLLNGLKGDEKLIDQILDQLELKMLSVSRAVNGNNTTTFILSVTSLDADSTSKDQSASTRSGKSEVQLNLAGTEPVPLDVVRLKHEEGSKPQLKMVFSTSVLHEDMDQGLLVANRVAAMYLVRQNGGFAAALTPKVYAWSDGKGGAGQTWCLMEYLQGVPLCDLWESLDLSQRCTAIDGMAKLLSSLQKTRLPHSANPFGAFTFRNPLEQGSPVEISESCFHYGGPYPSSMELYRGYLETQYGALKSKVPNLKGWRGSDVILRDGTEVDLGEGLKVFCESLARPDGVANRLLKGLDVGPVFIHGDFNMMNVLVDPLTLSPTGILDFEFAQSGPPLDEFFQSFAQEGLLVEGTRAEPLDPHQAQEWQNRQSILFRDPPTLPPSAPAALDPEIALAQSYVESLKYYGVTGPWSYDPDLVDRFANLYWFAQDLCSGLVQRESFWTSTDEKSVKRRERVLKSTRENLEGDMRRWL